MSALEMQQLTGAAHAATKKTESEIHTLLEEGTGKIEKRKPVCWYSLRDKLFSWFVRVKKKKNTKLFRGKWKLSSTEKSW
jgi:hypothetical protein